jgi:predicted RNA-binding protein YlxR (DUF448 family)
MQQDQKTAMVRLAVDSGIVTPDFESKASGRGGYLHPRAECLNRFAVSKAREFRSLRMKIDKQQRGRIVELIRQRLDRNPALT